MVKESIIPLLTDHHFELLASSIMEEQEALEKEMVLREKRIKDDQAALELLRTTHGKNKTVLDRIYGKPSNGNGSAIPTIHDKYIQIQSTHQLFQKPNQAAYKSDWDTWDKIKFILERDQNLMTAREIIDNIYGYEPELKQLSNEERNKFETKVFTALNYKIKVGMLKRYKGQDDKEYKNGLPDWFAPDGFPKTLFLL